MIKAISFDLWDTVIHDNSDEPKRAAQGLRSKHDQRRHLLWEALDREQSIPFERVRLAYDVGEAAFNHVWRKQHVTWKVAERIQIVLDGLGRQLAGEAFDEVVRAHEEMELEVAPDAIAGADAALSQLSARFKLAVISDAIVSPGRCLRRWLEREGLKQYFSGFAFSDEVGHSKPHRSMFEAAARELQVELHEMIHVGDRDHNDIKGPQALGLKAVLFTATRDRDRDHTSADAICDSYAELPAVIERLASTAGRQSDG